MTATPVPLLKLAAFESVSVKTTFVPTTGEGTFGVLVGANLPAVLMEIGYLSNPDEENALTSGAHQDRVAGAIFDAISRFRDQVERPVP